MTYEELVKCVNDDSIYGIEDGYHGAFEAKKGIKLQEINAWTYWQGAGVRNPKIVVLGQDWGSTKKGEPYFRAIDEMIKNGTETDEIVHYFDYSKEEGKNKRDFETDENLAWGLSLLQQDGKSRYPDVLHRRYSELFFTNLISGYRKDEKSTGGFKSGWITSRIKDDLIELLKILSPEVVICLGKDTFLQAVKIYEKKNPLEKSSWNTYLDGDFEPVEVALEKNSNKTTFLYPMPHPGYFGKLNRNRKRKNGKSMEDDWKRLSDWLEHGNL